MNHFSSPAVDNSQIWAQVCDEVCAQIDCEPALASFLFTTVLAHSGIEGSLSYILASNLDSPTMPALTLRALILEAFTKDDNIIPSVLADLQAVFNRDPACFAYSLPLLYFKGFKALQSYRVAHHFWVTGREYLALHLQSRISEVFTVDIHPGAIIGRGIMMDHASGIVIGETTVIDDDVSLLHAVTLGGSGKETGDRHPKIGRGVMIGAGAKVLGNIRVCDGSQIGAGSVVLSDVPPHTSVAGVPAKPIGTPGIEFPALGMDQAVPCRAAHNT